MKIRPYTQTDKKEVIKLIQQTIYFINKQDYSPLQIKAWAEIDWYNWDNSLINHLAIVGVKDKKIVGFSDMTESGFLDRLFTHQDNQREGVATALLKCLEKHINSDQYSTYASITAKRFFEEMGYRVVKENQTKLRGETFLNYYMIKNNHEFIYPQA